MSEFIIVCQWLQTNTHVIQPRVITARVSMRVQKKIKIQKEKVNMMSSSNVLLYIYFMFTITLLFH